MARSRALTRAIKQAGGTAALARKLCISSAAVSQWSRCPVRRMARVAQVSGVTMRDLCPWVFK